MFYLGNCNYNIFCCCRCRHQMLTRISQMMVD